MLQYIEVNKIDPHPDNPRKDLGDLTELAESIKVNGILQNLTVVPWFSELTRAPADDNKMDGYYRVVVGHRRLAAAKLAGLVVVPCMISDMGPRDQVATMLLENIQRNDLTVYEQAQGFQLMLNFGDTVDDIAERTGFSQTTVRRRVKLLELDQEKLQQSIVNGAKLQDYAELNKIEDIEARNNVLEVMGTSDFKWRLQSALEEQEIPKRKEALLEFFKDWAKCVKKEPNNSSYVCMFYRYKLGDFKKPEDADKVQYYLVDNMTNATLYKQTDALDKKKTSETKKIYKERESQIKELTKRAYQLRRDFVLNFPGGKKYTKGVMDFAMTRLVRYGGADPDALLKLLEIEIPEDEKKDYMETVNIKRDLILGKYLEEPERVMLIISWATIDNNENYYNSHSYNSTIDYNPNPTLDAIYDGLVALGYEMSEEEQQLRDGTHELFLNEV